MNIKSITLLDNSAVKLPEFSVIVGGNGVGKTTFLKEAYEYTVSLQLAKARWIKATDMTPEDARKDAMQLLDSLDANYPEDATTERTYRSRAVKLSADVPLPDPQISASTYRYLEGIASGAPVSGSEIVWLTPPVRIPFVAYLSCDHRLAVPHQMQITPLNGAATDSLNVLWRSKQQFEAVAARIRERFSVELILLDHRATQLELGISDSPIPKEFLSISDVVKKFETVDQWRRDQFTPIIQAGHGIRAMTSLLLSVFEPVNHILLIDEPELHLYPAEKRALGASLVSLARTEKKQVVCVTHDASFLQGVLDAGADINILSLSKVDTKSARRIKSFAVSGNQPIGASATQREYLNSLFYRRVIIVEGSSDRLFYQGVSEHFHLGEKDDIGFAAGSGKGGTTVVAALCSDVGIPFSVIFDFDILLEDSVSVLGKIVKHKGCVIDIEKISGAISSTIDFLSARYGSKSAAKQALKQNGIKTEGISVDLLTQLSSILAQLGQCGIAIVSIGELEQWCPQVNAKARFAETALEEIRAGRISGESIKDFLSDIHQNLVNNASS